MTRNLLTKIGVGVVLAVSPFLYSGCQGLRPTTYGEKCDDVILQKEQKRRTGDYNSPVIVPLFTIGVGNSK